MYDLEWCHGCLEMFEAGEDHETKDEDRQTYTLGQIWGSMVGWNMYCACFVHVCMLAFPFQYWDISKSDIYIYYIDILHIHTMCFEITGVLKRHDKPQRSHRAVSPWMTSTWWESTFETNCQDYGVARDLMGLASTKTIPSETSTHEMWHSHPTFL